MANKEDQTAEVDLIDLTMERQSMTIDLTIDEPKTTERIQKLLSSEQVHCDTIPEHRELPSKLPPPFPPISSNQRLSVEKTKIDCPSGRSSMAKKARFMTLREYKEVSSIDKSENVGHCTHEGRLEGMLSFFANNF